MIITIALGIVAAVVLLYAFVFVLAGLAWLIVAPFRLIGRLHGSEWGRVVLAALWIAAGVWALNWLAH